MRKKLISHLFEMEIIHTKSASRFAEQLGRTLGLSVFPDILQEYACGELHVSVPKFFYECIVVAPTVTSNDWIELFLLLDALRHTHRIILCLPYIGYSRQDKDHQNESYAARMFPRLLETLNISNCIVLDTHSDPMFHIPTLHASAACLFTRDIRTKYTQHDTVVVSPDTGGAYRAERVAKELRAPLVVCSKTRNLFNTSVQISVTDNVHNKICILIDDIIDSGATLCHSSEALLLSGCQCVVAYATHGVLSGEAVKRLERSNISEITLTDSVGFDEALPVKFKRLSIVSLIAETIGCIL